MSFRAFLFDLDGTLVDTDTLQYELWKVIVDSLSKELPSPTPLSRDMYDTYIRGQTDDNIWVNIMTQFGSQWNLDISSEERQRWTTWKEEEFLRRIDETVPVLGGREFMTRVSDDWTFIGIVTNSKQMVAERLIDRLGISNLVDILITADNCAKPKPSPVPYQMAMRALGVSPENTVIFEDSPVGIQSALGVCPSRIYVISGHGVKNEPGGNRSSENLYGIKDYTDITLGRSNE